MVVHGDEGLACPHVPDDYQVITAWGQSKTLTLKMLWFFYSHSSKETSICVCVLPAVSSMLRAVGCQLTMPTRLEWPSKTTTGSESGRVSE